MKRGWIVLSAAVVALAGCGTTPKRQMRMEHGEEIPTIPPNLYTSTPDLPRDQPLLTPKAGAPNLNTNGPNRPGLPTPMPGGPQGPGR
jgi:hypothetical protein